MFASLYDSLHGPFRSVFMFVRFGGWDNKEASEQVAGVGFALKVEGQCMRGGGRGFGRGGVYGGAECTKIARFSAAAAAIFTAPQKLARCFEAPRCVISSAKKIASESRFLLRRKWVKMVLAAEFPAIPSSAVKSLTNGDA